MESIRNSPGGAKSDALKTASVAKLICFYESTKLATVLVFLVQSSKYWSFPGGKKEVSDKDIDATLEREYSEEIEYPAFAGVLGNIFAVGKKDKTVQLYAVRMCFKDFVGMSVKRSDEILNYKWADVDDVERLTQGYWKSEVIRSAIQDYMDIEDARQWEQDQREYEEECEIESLQYARERRDELVDSSMIDDDFTQYDSDDDDPCSDCDDSKIPYAARSCEECRHGGTGCLGLISDAESDALDSDTADDGCLSYRLDMWGIESIRPLLAGIINGATIEIACDPNFVCPNEDCIGSNSYRYAFNNYYCTKCGTKLVKTRET